MADGEECDGSHWGRKRCDGAANGGMLIVVRGGEPGGV